MSIFAKKRNTSRDNNSDFRRMGTILAFTALIACGHDSVTDVRYVRESSGLPPAELVVSPEAVAVAGLEKVQFSVSARDARGTSTNIPVTWSATGGAITQDGWYTAGAVAGSFSVTVSALGGLSQTALVEVALPNVAEIRVTPPKADLIVNQSVLLVAETYDLAGGLLDREVTWATSDADVASVDSTGNVIAMGEGEASVTAVSGSTSAVIPVFVTPVPAAFVEVAPASVELLVGETAQFEAITRDSIGNVLERSVVWSANGGMVDDQGVYTAGSTPGSYLLTATAQGGSATGESQITVLPPELIGLDLSPDLDSLSAGDSLQFTATAEWTDGGGHPYEVSFSATGGTISTDGMYVADSLPGAYQITAVEAGGAWSDTSTVVVLPPELIGLDLSPDLDTLYTGISLQFTATAEWSDGGDHPYEVSFSATGGTISADGLYLADSLPGAYQVTAVEADGAWADTSTVVVVLAPVSVNLVDLSLNPSAVTLESGGTQQFSVEATWSDGSTGLPGVTFSSTGGSVSSGGLYTSPAASGTYRVIATASTHGLADTANVTVSSPPPPPSGLPASCQGISHTRLVEVASREELRAALGVANPGDLIVLKDRVFTGGYEIERSGTASKGIGLCGSPRAVIDAGTMTEWAGLRLRETDYWTFAGFTITNGLFGIMADESSHNRVSGLTIHGIGQEAIHFKEASSHNVIEGNAIYNTGLRDTRYGEGVYIGSSYGKWTNGQPDRSDGNIIVGNTFGPNVRADHIDIKEGTTGGVISGNVFDGTGMDSAYEWQAWVHIQGNGYKVEYNSGRKAVKHGFKVFKELAGWGNNNVFSNNTADVQADGYGFLIDMATSGNVVQCNNVARNAGSGLTNISCQGGSSP
ncbi:Ig-like domain-containing protein [Gemmatimonadota bacterium]